VAQDPEFEGAREMLESEVLQRAWKIEAMVPCMAGHSERVAAYAMVLGGRLGLPERERSILGLGGLVHDIGKVAIPDHILLSPYPLSAEEREVVERHPVVGEHICRSAASLAPVLPMVRHHHEELDGSGYPDGLRGEQIPLTARILQTVDIFDALTSERPYRGALTAEAAFEIMCEEVRHGRCDAFLVEEFFAWVRASRGRFSSLPTIVRPGKKAAVLADHG